MTVINGKGEKTYIRFDVAFTTATLDRLIDGKPRIVKVNEAYFSMAKLDHLTSVDDETYKGLAQIQAERARREADDGTQ